MKEKYIKVNFGAGITKMKGFKSLDFNPDLKPDILCDLNKFPWPFKNDTVEYIHSKENLEHLWCELTDFVRECRRVLKPVGKVEIITHNNFFITNRIAFLFGTFKQNQGWHVNHSFILKPSELKRLLELNNFDVELRLTSGRWKFLERFFPDLFSPYIHLIARKRS